MGKTHSGIVPGFSCSFVRVTHALGVVHAIDQTTHEISAGPDIEKFIRSLFPYRLRSRYLDVSSMSHMRWAVDHDIDQQSTKFRLAPTFRRRVSVPFEVSLARRFVNVAHALRVGHAIDQRLVSQVRSAQRIQFACIYNRERKKARKKKEREKERTTVGSRTK